MCYALLPFSRAALQLLNANNLFVLTIFDYTKYCFSWVDRYPVRFWIKGSLPAFHITPLSLTRHAYKSQAYANFVHIMRSDFKNLAHVYAMLFAPDK